MPAGNVFDTKNPISSKISKIIEFTTQADESFFECLRVLSESYTSNNVRSRRNLRGTIETSRLNLAERFLQEMSSMEKASKSRMEEMINETNVNQARKNSVMLTHLAANALLSAFHIPPEDWSLVTEQINSENSSILIAKLERAKSIRQLIINTMGVPSMPLVKDLLDSSTTYIDKAFTCLYHWIKREVSTQNFEAVEISIPFRKCLKQLQERPIFFKYILDEYANARRQLIVEAFLRALTIGLNQVEGSTKPIELQSHDPARYAGDMLAWLHQATASEKEYLRSLTSEKADKELIYDCLDNITSGLAHPLQLRLEQMLVTEYNSVILYKINNLLHFYTSVILNLLNEKSTLYTTLAELQTLSWNLFVNALQRQTSEMLSDVESPRHDLMPSTSTMDVTRLLEAVLTIQDMSCALSDVQQNKSEEIVSVVVKPLMEHYEQMAQSFLGPQSVQKDLSPEGLVYLLNSLHSLHGALARLAFTGAQIAAVAERMEEVLTSMTQAQTLHILTSAGLHRIYDAINSSQGHEDVSLAQRSIPGCSQEEIVDALREFNATYLSSPDTWELPEAAQIAFPRPRNALRRRTADLVHSVYVRIYEKITNPKSGYTNPWPEDVKTPIQVADLLLPSSTNNTPAAH
ncbi:unnamed protein product [Rodentolepis nana]|uniref:Conserved oligomeric Golgi complex subunit 6 n=1 Tax=Rodentolepis nana TaxID=102285 RepID=A0A0R3T6T6_RODNA|nr:unnamed protein product [Rodentolepis nana]